MNLADNHDPSRDAPSERRQWPRDLNSVGEVQLGTDPGSAETVRVLDESLTGIGVEVDAADHLQVGQEVALRYEGRLMYAVIRYIGPSEGGKFRLGLEWGAAEIRDEDVADVFTRLAAAESDG